MDNVEVPKQWSQIATDILAQNISGKCRRTSTDETEPQAGKQR